MTYHLITPALLLAALAGAPLAAAEGHKHDHTAAVPLGSATIGVYTVAAMGDGAPVAGAGWHAYIQLTPATPAPKAVRVWVGVDSGRGSAKAKAEASAKQPGLYSAHVEVPNPVPVGAKVWVSIEPTTGDAVQGAILPPQPKSAPGHGHSHGPGGHAH